MIMELTREEKIILWARQWAEFVDAEEVLKMWKDKIGFKSILLPKVYDTFDLEDLK